MSPAGAPCARRSAAAALALGLALAGAPEAGGGEEAPAGVLRVGTSGDYAPFSVAPGAPEGAGFPADAELLGGFDPAVARAFARDRGLALDLVRFRWPELLAGLRAGRFAVAMSGVTVRPERSVAGRFTVPVAESGAVVLVRDPERHPGLDALDAPGATLAVNAGGHLERVARARFPSATLRALPENDAVRRALAEGAVDAAVTDSLEAPAWRESVPGSDVLGPFTRDAKAYLLRADRPELARALDAWLLEREAEGDLARLREAHGALASSARTALPLRATLEAVEERLALMPHVAEAKRRSGAPVAVPEREARVLRAAVRAVREAAARSGRPAPAEPAVRRLYRAQIEAAKAVQRAALAGPPAAEPSFSLGEELRPALLRIGERMAALLPRLPRGLERAAVREAARRHVAVPGLEGDERDAVADALAALARAERR